MLNLHWHKYTNGEWCDLDGLPLSQIKTTGVYIIWHAGNPARVVRIGQGDIAQRLGSHKNDLQITSHALQGKLYVTWASVAAHQLDGIERYLAETWNPLVGTHFPLAIPIAVNSPWQ